MSELLPNAAHLVALLQARAVQQPDAPMYTMLTSGALPDERMSYAELDRRARAVAALLQQHDAAGERVLLLYPPGLDYIVAFFGCLYANAIAVPAYPPQLNRPAPRLQAIVADAQATLALTTSQILANMEQRFAHAPDLAALRWLTLDALDAGLAAGWQAPSIDAGTLAFLQYTSGSTAAPKGVMLSHGNLLHNLGQIRRCFGHTTDSRGVIWLPPYHDMGLIGGILQPLYAGFPVTLMSPLSFLQRPIQWLQAISQSRATTSGGPNFAYELCVRKITPEQRATLDLSSWDVAFTGAEPIRRETLDAFAATFAECGFRREAFYPCYGLAEATLIVSGGERSVAPIVRSFQAEALEQHRAVDQPEQPGSIALVSSGQNLPDQQLVIAHPQTAVQCRPGEVGEIWVASPSVAQGYWSQPDATAHTFHARLADTQAGPFLRTGDLGVLQDGELFITGRLKDLIIIRGRNHYPQDIEQTVEQSYAGFRPGSGAAFAVEVAGEERLVVVQELERRARNADVEDVAAVVRQAVAAQHDLQLYGLVLIKPGSIPKTSSGKIQRHACRIRFENGTLDVLGTSLLDQTSVALDEVSVSPEALEALPPEERQSALEAYLREQIARRLRIAPSRLEPSQPISAFGLDSLAAVELSTCIEADLGVVVPMVALLQGHSIAQIAAEILTQSAAAVEIQPATPDRDAEYPLSYGQRALWFLYQLASDSAAYHIAHAVRISSSLDVVALRRAFQALVDRHAALRTMFVARDGEPVQRILPEAAIALTITDAAGWSDATLHERLADEAQRPFDLAAAPLLRVQLFRRSPDEQILLLVIHHIIADFWSLAVLLQDLGRLYTTDQGEPVALAEPQLRYTDYARWQNALLAQAAGEQLWRYWRDQLAGAPTILNLPTDRPRPATQTYRGAAHAFSLGPTLSQQIAAFGDERGLTRYMTLLAAFQVLLFRYSGQDDLLVGSPTAGRSRAGLAELVGYFVNPVVLRGNGTGNPTFAEFAGRVRETVLGALAHQEYPFPLLVEQLQPDRDPSRSPLAQVFFAFQQTPPLGQADLAALALGESGVQLKLGELEVESVALAQQAAQFDLTLTIALTATGLSGSLQYNSDLFDAATIARMAGHFEMLLQAVVAGPNTPIMQLPLLTDAERQQIVHGWNATATDVPTRCVHDLVAAQAAQTPDAIALVCGAEHVTYAALERQANQLAQVLAVRGVGPETCVAILLDRSLDLIVASLAILKAGGAYLPLDPASPPERLAWLLADAHAAVVVTQQALAARLPQDVAVLALDREQQAIDQAPIVPVTTHAGLDQLAYVIYTSGSTGQPKGVAVPHAGLANLVAWHQQTYHIQPRDRASVVASPAFDASVWEIWPYLASGAQLHLPDDATRSDPAALVGWLQAHDITLSFLPTALAEAALAQPWPASTALRALLVGGDQLHPLPEGLPFPVYNHYGPTESTVVASWQPVAFDSAGSLPPIGRPIANTTIYLLDRYLQPVPVGVAGELYIGGVGVARGYLHRPDLTAERFVPDLFTDRPGQRLYRTGDLARYQVDGVLDYLGRIDQQVKLRGYRIELGEIEATLRAHEAVHDAVVVLRDDRLVAYIVGEQTNKGTSEQENKASTDSPPSPVATGEGSGVRAYGEGWPAMLRAFLAQRLPAYMLPSAFVTLAALPVTPSGKVDRRALPAPDRADLFASTGYVPLATPTEHIVAGVWAEVLGVAQIGRHDHFFALGGHSLNATQVIARLRTACGLDLPLPLIFEHPQLSVLAAAIDQALPGASTPDALPPLVPQPHQADQPLPLSFAQQRLWFLDQLITRRAVYNIPGAFQLRGELDLRALECSLTAIVERHEILRTVFVLDGDQPVQVVLPAQPVSVALEDLRAQSRQIAEELVERLAVAEAQRPFDLRRGPLLRATLLRLADNEHVLLIAVHHIAADGWSLRIFMRELAAQYTAEVRGQPADMPSLPVQYADYALWQRNWLHGAVLEQQLDYWRRQLSDLPALQLPTDFSRPAQPTFNGASQPLALASDVTEALRDLSRREGTTLFQTLLAIFQVLLARYSGQDDIVVGAPIAGRTQREVEPLIGYFGNTLVLRANLSGQPDFREVLQRVRETTLAAYAHQDLPFDQLVDALQPDRDLSRSPLFQVLFDLQHDLPVGLELPGLRLQQMPLKQGVAKFDLSLLLVETPEGLHGRIEYSTDLFAATTIARMAGHLQKLATEIAATPNTPVALLPLLTDAERQQIVHGWNATATEVPTRCVHDLVTAQAAQTPAAIALVCGTEQLTYAELERRANQLAQVLAARGVGPETCVAILLDRSLDLIIASLAILKAGGAYLPLDPATPPERIAWLLADARASLVVTQQALAVRLPQDVAVLALDREQQAIDRAPTMPLAVATSGDQLAYIIYTSGSTGQPKGVAVPHAGLANLVAWHQQTYHIQPRDRASVVASPAFDASVWEIWPYLASGAQLHIPAEETRSDPAALVGWLHAQQITLSFLPTALAEAALAQTWSAPTALRALLVGGDQLHPLPEDRAVPVYNHYGPTESTVVASWQPVAFDSAGSLPPIGRPIANTTIYLLDRYLQPVPVGVAGELYIGGVGVARGYLHRPDLTAERFVPDPFSDTAGSRLYRTGDLARFQVDGVLDYLGRIDQQVKLRGYRIELGEIEAALRQHEAVHDAVVVVREESGDKRLVAYVVQNLEPRTKNLGDAEGGSRFLGLGSALRQHLSARLPAYMLPSAIVMLAALPLTSSGKVERRALPAPDRADLLESTGYVPLATPTEHLVAGVWAEVLGVAQIGRHDHFFALGGHSLNATQVIARLRTASGRDLPLPLIFEHPQLSALAAAIDQALPGASTLDALPLVPQPRQADQPLPLSFAQQRLWLLQQITPEDASYNIPLALELTGQLDVAALHRSLSLIVARHEVLRTSFALHGDVPVQQIAPTLTLPLPLVDLTQLPAAERSIQAAETMRMTAQHPFDLAHGPLLLAALLRFAPDQHRLLLTLHHIAADGWSTSVLVRELSAAYAAYRANAEPVLPALPIQYADYAVWQRQWMQGDVLDRLLGYWTQQLAGSPPILELPTDYSRPTTFEFHGAEHTFVIDPELTAQLHALSQREDVTLFMTLLATFNVLLSRYTGQHDLVVGSPVAGRSAPDVEPLIGFFVNMLALRTDLSGNPSFRDLLARVRETCLAAYAHQDLSFEQLVEALQPQRDLSRTPIFQVLFALQNTPHIEISLPELTATPFEVENTTAKYDLSVTLTETDGGLACTIEYRTDLFAPATIARLAAHFQTLLAAVVRDPSQQIGRLPLLSQDERHQLLAVNTAQPVAAEATLHELFEAQAARTPEAVAVVWEDQQLSYDQLNRRANQLAHYLRARGVGPEMRIGLCVERSLDLIVGLLGILKAGAAYVPLDPALPLERQRVILDDTQVALLVTQQRLAADLPEYAAQIVCLDADHAAIAQLPATNPPCVTTPDQLAYIIYTSGSTGRPKGVMIPHGNVARIYAGWEDTYQLRPGQRHLQMANVTFDVFVGDLARALCSGGTLVLCPRDLLLAPDQLADLIHREAIAIAEFVPAVLRPLLHYLREANRRLDPLGVLICGSDSWSMQEFEQVRQLCRPETRVINSFGVTEATIDSTWYDATTSARSGDQGVPIGRPFRSTTTYILDPQGQPVPVGVAGELYLGGVSLARGYLNRPELTADRFVPDPFSPTPGARLYRTGDLARWLPDGTIEFLGRADTQVKLRGYRIELGEIEAALRRHEAVHDAVVVLRDERLVAYVVENLDWRTQNLGEKENQEQEPVRALLAAPSFPPPPAATDAEAGGGSGQGAGGEGLIPELRSFLKGRLPEYMVPTVIMLLPALPLSPSGKVNRAALPVPELTRAGSEQEFVAPRTPTEMTLAEIWREILGIERVGIHDPFFELGGHSLSATRVLARVRDSFTVELAVRDVFEHSTIAELALLITQRELEQGYDDELAQLLAELEER